MIADIIGRSSEIRQLQEMVASQEPEFLAAFGRRRVGKTFLISRFFEEVNCTFFTVAGLKDGSLGQQLELFHQAIIKAFKPAYTLAPPKKWMQAFEQLDAAIGTISRNRRVVLFLDELPWMATPKSGLIQALDHYWNTRWSHRKKLILIACGSAASWMLDNLINATGGLYNRVTKRFHLMPLTLSETQAFLAARSMDLSPAQVLQIYMALGGIPFYLKELRKDQSVARNINRLCFQPGAPLIEEFGQLFASLFKHHEAHAELVRIIAAEQGGVTRDRIFTRAKKASTGGRLTKRLKELESAGFIAAYRPYGRTAHGVYYKVIDEYALFYLSWIEPFKNRFSVLPQGGKFWESQAASQRYKIWCGYAFETICLKHIDRIVEFLDIGHLITGIAPWRCTPQEGGGRGAQIDLLIERSDDVISMCEIKCHQDMLVVDKSGAEQIHARIAALRNATRTRKAVEVVFVTVHGVKHNKYTALLNSKSIEIADLFGLRPAK